MAPFFVSENHNHCLFSMTIVIAANKNIYFSRCHTTRTKFVFCFVLLLYLFILALFRKLFPSMMCVCIERHHPYKSNIGARTEFLAYSTFSNVVKTHFVCLFVCCVLFSILSFSTAGNIRQWTIHSCTQLSCLKGKRNEFDSIAKYFKSTELRFIPNESIRKIKPNS